MVPSAANAAPKTGGRPVRADHRVGPAARPRPRQHCRPRRKIFPRPCRRRQRHRLRLGHPAHVEPGDQPGLPAMRLRARDADDVPRSQPHRHAKRPDQRLRLGHPQHPVPDGRPRAFRRPPDGQAGLRHGFDEPDRHGGPDAAARDLRFGRRDPHHGQRAGDEAGLADWRSRQPLWQQARPPGGAHG